MSGLLCEGTVPAGAQQVIHVPADQQTIQAGIDAAQNGDTVLVAPGTYNENIDFRGKGITVTSGATSSAGAVGTIIKAPGPDSVVTIRTDDYEPLISVLNGFTITHFSNIQTTTTSTGDGIATHRASAKIINNLILENPGCGVAVEAPEFLLVQGNTVTSSSVGGCGFAAGYQFLGGAPILTDGGNILQVSDNLVVDNHATSVWNQGLSIKGPNHLLLQNNIVAGNSGSGEPLVLADDPDLSLVQNLIYGNTSSDAHPTAVRITSPGYTTSITMTNNTVIAPTNSTSALVLTASIISQAVSNNIFLGHGAGQAVTCYYVDQRFGSPQNVPPPGASFSNNDVFQGSTAQTYQCAQPGNTVGNLSTDPEFLNLAGGDLHTERTSPVVAAGDVDAPQIPALDLDGLPRTSRDMIGGTIGLGVYEVQPLPGIVGGDTAVSLTGSPNPASLGQTVTFTAAVRAAEVSAVPAGAVRFKDGSVLLTSVALDPSGTAVFRTSGLGVGTHTISAIYNGSATLNGSSATVTETITAAVSSFTLTSVPASVSVHAGDSATVTVSLTSVGQFAGPLKLSYGPLPQYATATFTPVTVTLTAGGTGTSSLVLSTAPPSTAAMSQEEAGSTKLGLVSGALFLLAPLSFARRRRLTRLVSLGVVSALLGIGLLGCSTIRVPRDVVAPGSYQVPITATDAGGNSKTVNLTLNVVA